MVQKPAVESRDGISGKDKLPFWKVVLSVIQASFGVQSHANRERDFSQGSIMPYVVAALIFTVVFVLSLLFIVRAVVGGL